MCGQAQLFCNIVGNKQGSLWAGHLQTNTLLPMDSSESDHLTSTDLEFRRKLVYMQHL